MTRKFSSLLAGGALIAMCATAQAAEPQRLTSAQLDEVTAGIALGASLGAGACIGATAGCDTAASQKAKAYSKLSVGGNGGIRIKEGAKAKSRARAASAGNTGDGAATVSLAVGVAAAGDF
jgi:hypothetical protein